MLKVWVYPQEAAFNHRSWYFSTKSTSYWSFMTNLQTGGTSPRSPIISPTHNQEPCLYGRLYLQAAFQSFWQRPLLFPCPKVTEFLGLSVHKRLPPAKILRAKWLFLDLLSQVEKLRTKIPKTAWSMPICYSSNCTKLHDIFTIQDPPETSNR